jgi:hypothetical protein
LAPPVKSGGGPHYLARIVPTLTRRQGQVAGNTSTRNAVSKIVDKFALGDPELPEYSKLLNLGKSVQEMSGGPLTSFALRRLICPAWAIVGGERTTIRSFVPRKSAL